MKTLTFGLLSVALASASLAGDYAQTTTTVQAPVPTGISLYNAGEFQVDLFGAYAFADSGNRRLLGDDEAFGGGLGFNYFITRNFGVGVEGSLFDTDGDILGTTNVNVILRFPIAETGLAPYAFGGGGVSFNADDLDSDDFSDAEDRLEDNDEPRDSDDVVFIAHAGAGLEYRFNPNFSLFTDARYTWSERDDSDFGLARAGVRFAF